MAFVTIGGGGESAGPAQGVGIAVTGGAMFLPVVGRHLDRLAFG